MTTLSETANFYDANAGPVYGYCLSLCADSELAVNAFHRAMIRAWSAGGGRVRAFTFARAECRMRGLRTPIPAIDETDRDARALAPVFTRLPPRDAEVAELTLRFGLGATELAGVFGLPVEHAQRLVRAARAEFVEALTAESLVGVSEGVLSELVRSAHPLARVGGLMPPVEPPADVRDVVLADLLRLEPEERRADRHGTAVLPPYIGCAGPGPSRARRLVVRSAVLACSMLVAVGFVTGLSRPSGVESMWTPPSRPVADPPLLPPASVEPSSHKPAPPRASPAAARPAEPAAHGASGSSRRATAPRPRRGWPYPGDRMAPRYDWDAGPARPYGSPRDGSRERLRAPSGGPYGRYDGYGGFFDRRGGPYDKPYDGSHGGRHGGRGGGWFGGEYGGGHGGGGSYR